MAHIVEGVTKISKIEFASREEAQAESVRKMVLAMVDDIRVVMIKLADRLHNMRTLEHLSPERQIKIARETQEIYAPIAHRLGMGKIRGELEDLAFQYVDPIAYNQVKDAIESRRKEGEAFLAKVQGVIEQKLRENNIEAQVEARIKRIYSIWQKLQKQRISVDQIYDMMALRIITQSVNDCYAVLGLIHNQWRPVPGRIKDMIAMPRPNLYQSLHTTVMAENGQAFEVQIRTEEMHKMAEEGIAAHWKYKDGPISAVDEKRLAWLRQVVEWQREVPDPNEFLSTLKIDLYPEEVYTFSPERQDRHSAARRDAGRFRLHHSLGSRQHLHRRQGERTHRAAALQAALRRHRRDSDPARPSAQPRLAGLREVVARAAEDQALAQDSPARARHRNRPQAHREGSAQVSHRAEGNQRGRADARLRRENGLGRPDDLLAAIGYGKFSARSILARLAADERGQCTHPAANRKSSPATFTSVVRRVFGGDTSAIKVKGHDDLLVYRARCCNPIRGEDIVGYVTRGKGVAVHSKTCTNVENLMYEPERRIAVEWGKDGNVGTTPAWADRLSRQAGGAVRQPSRHAEADHRRHQRCQHQHPQHRSQDRRNPRHRRHHRRHRRRQAPGAHHHRRAQDPRRARRAAGAEGVA